MSEIAEGSTPQFSVVIPHLNEPGDLRRCLSSLQQAGAKGHSFEIIVADNGSRESPQEVCDAFPNTRLVVELSPGPGPARNAGAALARGEIICFIDADCVAAPDWFDVYARYFEGHPRVDFIGGEILILPRTPGKLTMLEAYEAVFSYRVRLFVERDKFAATGNMAVRRCVFNAVGPFDGIAQHEDKTWGQRAVAEGYCIAYLPTARIYTPGCATFGELAARVRRQVAHDFNEQHNNWSARAKWLLKSFLMVPSPLWGIGEIVRSPHVNGFAKRCEVFACLCGVRFYRSMLMLGMLRRDRSATHLLTWNRPAGAVPKKDG